MEKVIIEITKENLYLSLKRGFICIEDKVENTIDQISIDSILSLVISSNNSVITKNIITTLTMNDVIIIFCNKNYIPSSITLPYANHWQNGERIRKQISASIPLQKSICKTLIQTKIYNQSLVLEWFKPNSSKIARLRQLSKTVKSGDTGNNEAIAAQIYFRELFGNDFRRDRSMNNVNILLNYIYTVLRACVARAIAGVGLLPALGIIHTNKLNPFTLVDDVIEAYRPLADSVVVRMVEKILPSNDEIILTPEIKRDLVSIISLSLEGNNGKKALSNSIFDTANSLAKSYVENKNLVEIDRYITP